MLFGAIDFHLEHRLSFFDALVKGHELTSSEMDNIVASKIARREERIKQKAIELLHIPLAANTANEIKRFRWLVVLDIDKGKDML